MSKYLYEEYWMVNYCLDGKRLYKVFTSLDELKELVDAGASDFRISVQKAIYPFFIN